MIIIKTPYFEHKYTGDIKMEVRRGLLYIEGHVRETLWEARVFDLFWMTDVVSIKGTDDQT